MNFKDNDEYNNFLFKFINQKNNFITLLDSKLIFPLISMSESSKNNLFP